MPTAIAWNQKFVLSALQNPGQEVVFDPRTEFAERDWAIIWGQSKRHPDGYHRVLGMWASFYIKWVEYTSNVFEPLLNTLS